MQIRCSVVLIKRWMPRLGLFLLFGMPWLVCSQNVQVHVLPVQGNVYMFVGARGNVAVQTGKDGVLLVDTMPAPFVPSIFAEIKKLTDKPIRYIIDTSGDPDHVGGNNALALSGAPGAAITAAGGATVIAQSNTVNALSAQNPPLQTGMPTDEYFLPTKDLYFNGEPVIVFHEPKAHTDGDSMVLFRRSDVISSGDIFSPDRYPGIDIERGGTVQGEITALNHLLHLTVPERLQDGGTRVIPGHGRLCNEADVVEYRDMVTIVRDRVQAMIKDGMSFEQVKSAKPTLDYDPQYGSPERFLQSVYRSLSGKQN
jgi:cyclase